MNDTINLSTIPYSIYQYNRSDFDGIRSQLPSIEKVNLRKIILLLNLILMFSFLSLPSLTKYDPHSSLHHNSFAFSFLSLQIIPQAPAFRLKVSWNTKAASQCNDQHFQCFDCLSQKFHTNLSFCYTLQLAMDLFSCYI